MLPGCSATACIVLVLQFGPDVEIIIRYHPSCPRCFLRSMLCKRTMIPGAHPHYLITTVPYMTVYITPAPPGPIFHGRYLHTWNVGIASVPARSALETTSRRELSEDASFGIGTLLVVEQSSLEKTASGVCVIYTDIFGSVGTSVYVDIPISFRWSLCVSFFWAV